MRRLLFSVCAIMGAPLLLAAGWLAHSSTVPHCTDPQTKSFCEAARNGSIAIAFWGDSITRGQSQIDYPNSWAGLTERFLIDILPDGTNVTFSNLSVDGASIGNMRAPDQPLIDGIPWSEAVQAARPDLLFIAMGMNSTGDAFNFGQILRERVRFAKSWDVPPTIVLVTPIIPTDDADSPASRPEWVDADAMQVRAIAADEGTLLVDANATHHYLSAAVTVPSMYLSDGGTGNAINHPSAIGHHSLLYVPVERLLQRVIDGFD